MVRRYEQMMLGRYKQFDMYNYSFKLLFLSVIQPCFQFRFNLYLCKTQNLNAKFEMQFTKQLYLHQDLN